MEKFRNLCRAGRIIMTRHATHRFLEREITAEDLKCVLATGRIIEEYPDDKPLASCLISGKTPSGEPLHVVASADEFIHVITAYRPDGEMWTDDFSRRKGK